MTGEKRHTCCPKLHTETKFESQTITILLNRNKNRYLVARKREISDGYMAYWSTEETSAIVQNRSSRKRVKDLFTRLIHSCQCHFIHIYVYMYVCIYNCLWIILIPSLWSELFEVRWQSLAKISWFLCHCEIIKNNFIKIRSCSVWILWLAICLVSFWALSQRAFGEKVV